jgi:anti-sigma-K factor RskA
MNEDEFAELAAGYALDALSPEDLVAFEDARAQHPEWEPWVVMDAATAASFAEGVAPVAPPPSARDALLARIGVTPQEGARTEFAVPESAAVPVIAGTWGAEPEPWAAEPVDARAETVEPPPEPAEPPPNTATIQAISRRNWTRGMLALAASLVVLVTLGFGAVSLNQWLNRPASVVALQQIEAASDAQSASTESTDGGTATAHWAESVGKVVLVTAGLPTLARDQSFEMWFVRDGEAVSAGTFEDGQDATVLLDGTMKPGDVIAVTVEQQGGSPDGQPTSDPIVTIPTT